MNFESGLKTISNGKYMMKYEDVGGEYGEYTQTIHIRKYGSLFYECDYDGYPLTEAHIHQIFLELEWEIVDLPQYTPVGFKQAYEYLFGFGDVGVRLNNNDYTVDFHYTNGKVVASKQYSLDWDILVVDGAWEIKNY